MPRSIVRLLICALLCALPVAGASAAGIVGAVYAMTNALASSGGNQILVFGRNSDGSLTLKQTVPTEGGGSGMQLSGVDTLGSQSSLTIDAQHHMLFAVNTESLAANSQDCQEGTITSFLINTDGTLTIANRIASGGMYPNSLTIAKNSAGTNVLYVLNAGGPGACTQPGLTGVPNITGFSVDAAGKMTLLADSVQAINPGALNGTGTGENCPPTAGPPLSPQSSFFCGLNPPAFARSPSEVRFAPDATRLLVSVKGTNQIYVFPVDANGVAGVPTVFTAPGPALPSYFGFTFDSHQNLLITELFGTSSSIPAGSAGAVSSFSIGSTGTLTPISKSVTNGGTASCWIAIEPTTGKYAYVSNNLSNTIASYSVGADGSLTLISGSAASGTTTSGPNDLVIVGQDSTSSYLYDVNAGDGTVGAFKINLADGSLTSLGNVAGLPVNTSAQGLTGFSAPFPTPLVAAVLPMSRSVQVGNTATAFATVINTGTATASACAVAPAPSSLPATFNYQTTNSSTNTLTGSVNTPVDIAGGGSQSFLVALTPSAAISPTQVTLDFGCANQLAAATTTGVDTLLLTASTTPVPDVISLAGTASNDGILHIPGAAGSSSFVVATANVGASGAITASANTGSATLPLTLTVCQTNPSTSACLAPPSASTTVTINQNTTPTFAIFGQANGAIQFNPASSRVFVQFTDSNGVIRGSTSVAVATQ